MGMYDDYVPQPPLACPQCAATLTGWQGKSGPCALFKWIQGKSLPARQFEDDDVAATTGRAQARLPDQFEIYTACPACGTWIEALGSCDGEMWSHVDFINPLEPPGVPEGWMPLRGDDRDLMLAELKREILPGHILAGQSLLPLLRRRGRDDLLVRTVGRKSTLWLVHLTWRAETDPSWPRAKSFESLSEFAEAHAD